MPEKKNNLHSINVDQFELEEQGCEKCKYFQVNIEVNFIQTECKLLLAWKLIYIVQGRGSAILRL
jgi:hypothetical protein